MAANNVSYDETNDLVVETEMSRGHVSDAASWFEDASNGGLRPLPDSALVDMGVLSIDGGWPVNAPRRFSMSIVPCR